MAKLTLLEMVQDILSSTDSDAVDDIFDTEESEQIVLHIRDAYYNLINTEEWPHLTRPVNLEGLGDTDNPTTIRVRDNLRTLLILRYNVREQGDTKDKWKTLTYLHPNDFIERAQARDTSDSNVQTIIPLGESNIVSLPILNDEEPTWFTSFNDEHITLDSFDSDVDSTIQSSKTYCLGEVVPDFTMDNDFVPDLPIHAFPLLLADSKAACHLYLKQQGSPVDERRSLVNRSRLRRTKKRVDTGFYDETARKNFGRKPARTRDAKLGRR